MLSSSCVSKQVCTRLLPSSRGPAIRPCVLRRPFCKLRAQSSGGRDLPKSWNQVMEWACKEFQREVDIAKPDENISIAKALMLLALEEEAALEVHPEMMEVLQSLPGLKLQSHASASTWSLERLDALTAEIKDLVMTSVGEWEQQASASAAELAHARNAGAGFASHRWEASDPSAAHAGASGAAKDAATYTYSASVTNTSNDSTCDGASGAAQVDSGDTVSVRTGANSSSASDSSSHGTSKGGEDAGAISSCAQASSSSNASTNAGACSEGREEEMALTKGRGFYKGYRPKGIAGSFLPERRGKKRDAARVAVEEGGTQAGKIGSSTIGAPQNLGGNRATDAPGNLNVHGTTAAPQNLSGSGATAAPSAPPDFLQLPSGLFKAFPGQVVSAINEVLYVRHGYAPCNRWGNIRDAQLSRVLEGGMGCSPALSCLYLVVARKLGIRMAVSLSLECGRYFVLYPLDEDGVSPLLLPVPSSPTASSSSTSSSPPPAPPPAPDPAPENTAQEDITQHLRVPSASSPTTSSSTTSLSSSSASSTPVPGSMSGPAGADSISSSPSSPFPSNSCSPSSPAPGFAPAPVSQSGPAGAHAGTPSSPSSPSPSTSSSNSSSPSNPAAGGRGFSCSSGDNNTTTASQPSSAGGFPQTQAGPSDADGATSNTSSNHTFLQSNGEQGHGIAGGGNAREGDCAEGDLSSLRQISSFSTSSSSSNSSSSGLSESDDKKADVGGARPAMTKRCVIDPYGCGGLLELEEVCELFEVEPEVLLQPASQRQVLAALLARQMDAFFAKAVGCSASPASMVPLSIETALDKNSVQLSIGSMGVHALSRALAAAEKRMMLLPGNSEAQLKVALLHYFSRNFDDAYLELGTVLERERNRPVEKDFLEKGGLLLEKVRLELMFRENRF